MTRAPHLFLFVKDGGVEAVSFSFPNDQLVESSLSM